MGAEGTAVDSHWGNRVGDEAHSPDLGVPSHVGRVGAEEVGWLCGHSRTAWVTVGSLKDREKPLEVI